MLIPRFDIPINIIFSLSLISDGVYVVNTPELNANDGEPPPVFKSTDVVTPEGAAFPLGPIGPIGPCGPIGPIGPGGPAEPVGP
jgi:hypothetical protein